MTRYAIHLQDSEHPDYDGRRLSVREISEIETHLEKCEPCRNRLEETQREFQNIVDFVEDAGFADFSTHPEKVTQVPRYNSKAKITWNAIFGAPKIQLAITFGLVLLTLSSIFYLQLNRHPYAEWAVIRKPNLEFQVRGSSEDLLSKAAVNYQQSNFKEAVTLFKQFIGQKETEQLHHFTHFYAGISYLLLAEKKMGGWIFDYRKNDIINGIKHLQEVLTLTQNQRYLEDVHWFLAKAYLRLSDRNKALTELNKVLEFSGPRRNEAEELIENLSGM